MKKYIGIIFLTFSLFSCEIVDVLDKKPPYQADLEGAITNPKTVELALSGVYSNLPGESGFSSLWVTVSGSFKAGAMSKPSWWTKGNAIYYYERFWPVLSGGTDYDWDSDYKTIKNANFLLEALDGIDGFEENRKNEIIGELHFLRAFAYQRLMLRFCEYWDMNSELGLIVRNELPTINNIEQPRSSVKESYDLILADLEIAIQNCPEYSSCGYASKVAAKSYKAKVLFNMGKYAETVTLINDIISTYPQHGLTANYSTNFTNWADSKEIIFARQYGASDISSMEYRINAFESGKWGPTENYIRLLGDNPTDDVIDADVDPRYNAIIGEKKEVAYNYGVQGKIYKNYSVKKLSNASNDLPLIFMRTAELYLMKAEAIYRNGGSPDDAYAALAVVRNRAKANEVPHNTSEEIATAICNEWLIEMAFENNQEYLALRRFGIEKLLEQNQLLTEAFDAAKKKGADAEAQYMKRMIDFRILPIPSSEINGNPVVQNPGY